jgi:hypothetical protein
MPFVCCRKTRACRVGADNCFVNMCISRGRFFISAYQTRGITCTGSLPLVAQRVAMKLVAEYRKLAEEYRRLSNKLTRPKDKEALELMARAWDKIASKREDLLRSHATRELLGHVHQQTVREPRFTLPTPPDNVLSVFHRRCLSEPTRQSASFGGTSSTIVPR